MSTKAERAWMDDITQIGCIACLLFFNAPGTPGCPHHMLTTGGRRMGHLFTICLCDPGHHQNAPKDSGKISRHPSKMRFEYAYGTEESLLAKTRELVAQYRAAVGVRDQALRIAGITPWPFTTGRMP